ncbi:VWA domain-containing protein [Allokutzneria sp. A3M-2-11 16]|uniref:vWA domain-containing protein n=1 Tax=Allokutzneria sp. A3M-2-11 16 TaxID=2962043 RepID=UPI0020B77521|nr:VWA domain-containing protein [Allokutzneria sp. A3M-2-11 16]MCP3803696.1 VWA domain-containing protein [Allokutzneria sp. A3M-2-11 16]
MPRRTALLVGVLALATVSAPAYAAEQPEQPREYTPTMLVLDASGSMTKADAGVTRMDAAKNAVRSVVAAAPAEARMGLTVYGTSTGSSDAEKAAGCKDVSVLRKAEVIDKAALTAAVNGIAPRGYTPIGAALRTAADALPKSGPRSIVLVSDGIDTCAPPDPCEVAKELRQQGVELIAHTIGFGVDAAARKQLMCIAQSTGGTYTDAPDSKSLERVLPRVTASALRNYEHAGQPVAGTADAPSAPALNPGQYLDTIGRDEKRFYAVDVPGGATAYFSATMSYPRGTVPDRQDINGVRLRVFDANGSDCHKFESEQATMSKDGETVSAAITWEGAKKTGRNCAGAGRYAFQVEWGPASTDQPERLPLELLVGVEPPLAGNPGPAVAADKVALRAEGGPGLPVAGGGSFAVAGTLNGSGHYTDTLQQGEFIFYRVRLNWGQGLAYQIRYDSTPGRDTSNIVNVETTLYTPFRRPIVSDRTAYTGSGTVLPGNGRALATKPVRYANRTADDNKDRMANIAGWYYISVKLGRPVASDQQPPKAVPVHLDLTVAGEQEPGPEYRVAAAPERNTPVTVENTASQGSAAVVWIVVAVAAVLVVLLVIWFVVRSRRRQPTGFQR